MRYFVKLGTDEELTVDVLHLPTGGTRIEVDGQPIDVDCARAEGAWSVRADSRVWDLWLDGAVPELHVAASGARLRAHVESEQARNAAPAGPNAAAGGVVCAPMPGRVVKVLVAVGDPVQAGQPVVVVEAMKMENELCAEADGTVTDVLVEPGLNVDGGLALIRIGAATESGDRGDDPQA